MLVTSIFELFEMYLVAVFRNFSDVSLASFSAESASQVTAGLLAASQELWMYPGMQAAAAGGAAHAFLPTCPALVMQVVVSDGVSERLKGTLFRILSQSLQAYRAQLLGSRLGVSAGGLQGLLSFLLRTQRYSSSRYSCFTTGSAMAAIRY